MNFCKWTKIIQNVGRNFHKSNMKHDFELKFYVKLEYF